jgi:hypothetical protein
MRATVMKCSIPLALLVFAALATTAVARPRVVLGSRSYAAPNGTGWGTSRPREIYNGGDANGTVFNIHWSSWGGPTAFGVGKEPMFKPTGGYYDRPVVARLRPARRGRCSSGGPLAYTRLWVRTQVRPGGPFGKWFLWSGTHSLCRPGFG